MSQPDYGTHDGTVVPGRQKPYYTYSRKSTFKKSKGSLSNLDLTDNDDDDSNLQAVSVIYLWCLQNQFFSGYQVYLYNLVSRQMRQWLHRPEQQFPIQCKVWRKSPLKFKT